MSIVQEIFSEFQITPIVRVYNHQIYSKMGKNRCKNTKMLILRLNIGILDFYQIYAVEINKLDV